VTHDRAPGAFRERELDRLPIGHGVDHSTPAGELFTLGHDPRGNAFLVIERDAAVVQDPRKPKDPLLLPGRFNSAEARVLKIFSGHRREGVEHPLRLLSGRDSRLRERPFEDRRRSDRRMRLR